MPTLLSSADIAVVTLRKALPGAVPSKIYEAIGAGLPVVFAGGGEAAQIVSSAGAGVVAPPGDAGALAAAIAALAADPARRRQLGTAGRSAALQSYDRDVIGRDFVRKLEQCACVRDAQPAPVPARSPQQS
jgi:glycosyltransferase involved in cell wall biosynthesis